MQPWHGLFLPLDYGKTLELLEICPRALPALTTHQQSEELLSRPGEQDLTCHLCWDWIEDILKKQNFINTRLLRQESSSCATRKKQSDLLLSQTTQKIKDG